MTLASRIESMLGDPTDQLVQRFFVAGGAFAGTTFDDLPANPRDCFTTDDLVAVSLLGMRFTPRAVRALLIGQSQRLGELLAAVPDDVDLWTATDRDLVAANRLYAALSVRGDLNGVGPTTRSKLLARKRPRLIPIIDSVVRGALHFEKDSWQELRAALQQPGLPQRIEDLRPPGVGTPVSTLRLLDAAIWMRHSNGVGARAARTAVGL